MSKRVRFHCDAPGCGATDDAGNGLSLALGWWELQVTSEVPMAGCQSGDVPITHYRHACSAVHAQAVWTCILREAQEARDEGKRSQAEIRARYET